MVRGEIHENTAYIQARSSMARTMEVNGKARQAEGDVKSGHMKNLNSKMREDYEEFISLRLETRISRRPSSMFVTNWKHQSLFLLCCAKL